MNQLKYLLLCSTLLISLVCFGKIDSGKYTKLIHEGQRQLCELIENNEKAIADNDFAKMKFVVMLDPNSPNYTLPYVFNGTPQHPATVSPVKDSINNRMSAIYAQYHLELYFIYINSIDVQIYTTLPDSVNVHDLFTTSLYDDVSNTQYMGTLHDEITSGIINAVISPQNRDCIIYSQITYQAVFNATGEISNWKLGRFFKHTALEHTFQDLGEVYSDFYQRSRHNNMNATEDPLASANVLINLFASSLKCHQVRDLITQTFHPDPMKLLLMQLNYPNDYQSLTLAERKHILSVFAGYPMSADFLGSIGEERYSVRTITQTPSGQIENLLLLLSQPNYLNSDPQYHGTITNTVLIYTLMWRIDDGLWNEDQHYTQFVKAITDLMTSSNEVMANHLPSTDEEWLHRKIDWGGEMQDGIERIGFQKYDVELHGDGKLLVESQIVSRWQHNTSSNISSSGVHPYSVIWATNEPFQLDPFDLVFFTNRSNVSLLEDFGAHRNSVKVAPAIFLKYADDKQFDQNVCNTFTTTLAVGGSAAALMLTGGAVITAIEAADVATAVFEAAQFIGVSGQLGAEVSGNSTFQNVAFAYNSVVGFWGIGELLASASSIPTELLTQAKAGAINPASETAITEFRARYSQIESHLDELDPANRSRLDRMEEYLGEGVALNDLFARREAFINNLKTQYGELDFEGFHPSGVDPNSLGETLRNQILEELQNAGLNEPDKLSKFQEVVESGSTIPIKRIIHSGDKLYKFTPKDASNPRYSVYWLTKSQLDEVMQTGVQYEQRCGIPLVSHSAEYDVYEIVATENTCTFESVIAPTVQRGYHTTGGATQSLVLDRTKWSDAVKVNSFIPNY